MTGARLFLAATHLDPGRGGIGRVARLTALALLADGADLELVSLLDGEDGEVAGNGYRAMRGSRPAFIAAGHLAALSGRSFIYDSIGLARGHPFLPGLARPYAVWMHGVEAWEHLRPERMRALKRARRVLVNSRYTLERYAALHGPLPQAEVCWLGTEADEPPSPAPAHERPPTAFLLARFDLEERYGKGHEALIGCWPHVAAAVPGARLVIAGGGSGLQRLRALAKGSPAADLIEVRGFVPEAEIEALWRGADLFAMPSRGEGFGLVYAEAMRHGLPVIASRHDAGREVNLDSETGYNVDLDRPGELCDRLVRLLADAALRQTMGEAGRRRWAEHFRLSSFKSRLRPLVDEFVKRS